MYDLQAKSKFKFKALHGQKRLFITEPASCLEEAVGAAISSVRTGLATLLPVRHIEPSVAIALNK